jgi:hypothetical protein
MATELALDAKSKAYGNVFIAIASSNLVFVSVSAKVIFS